MVAARIEFIPRADHKEQWRAKLGFLLTLLVKEKNKNERGSYVRNSVESTGAAGKGSQSV